jgi:hypothetical protein
MVVELELYGLYTLYGRYRQCMEDIKRMGIVDFRAEVGKRVDAAHYLKESTIVTKGLHEEPRAALIPFEWYGILVEALAARGIHVPAAQAEVHDDL